MTCNPAIEPLALVVRGQSDKVVAYACGKCHFVARSESEARGCCVPHRPCTDCGALTEKRRAWTICDACRAKKSAEDDAARIANAEIVVVGTLDPDTMLYSQRKDKYYTEIEDYLDDCELDEEDLEPVLFTCWSAGLSFDAQQIVEHELEDHHEDAYDQVDDVEALQKALDEWASKQRVRTYYPDMKRAVRVDKTTDSAIDYAPDHAYLSVGDTATPRFRRFCALCGRERKYHRR